MSYIVQTLPNSNTCMFFLRLYSFLEIRMHMSPLRERGTHILQLSPTSVQCPSVSTKAPAVQKKTGLTASHFRPNSNH
jgi:hypothetical protein